MIHSLSFISNDNLAHNRHSQEIMTPVFSQCLELFKYTLMIPSLQEYQTYFEKFLKVIIENINYPIQVQSYIEELKKQSDLFQALIGEPLYKLEDFNF